MFHLPNANSPLPVAPAGPPWRVLVVDDEPEVHTITRLALRDCEFLNRGLHFITANNAAEAREVFSRDPDVALAFIDVVMETDHAGLDLVTYIRQQLGNAAVRLILRTGQPGAAPEREVIRDFDIDDYMAKTSIPAGKLYTATISSLRAYQRIRALQTTLQQLERYRDGLEDVIDASANLFETRSLQQLAQGLLQQFGGLLQGSRQSMLVQVREAQAGDAEPGYDLLARAGGAAESPIGPEVLSHLGLSLQRQGALHEGDVYVGYFKGLRGRVNLVYVDGLGEGDDLAHRLLNLFSRNIAIAFERLRQEHELLDLQAHTIIALVDALAAPGGSGGPQGHRLAQLSRLLGRGLGLSTQECQALFTVAALQALGPPWPGLADEGSDAAVHALLQAAALVAQQRHEHYDGSGRPLGLRGEDIHLHARVVHLAHAFDTQMHVCSNQPAPSQPQAVAWLAAGRGRQFDPQLVDRLLEHLAEAVSILQQHPDGPMAGRAEPPVSPAGPTGHTEVTP